MPLRKVISGGQTGADQAGLIVAKRFGLETGGTIPKGFRTLEGNRPDLGKIYGLCEHSSDSYVPRTYQNAKDADATVRLAADFGSRGEICTLKAIEKYGKPHFDVDLSDPPPVRDFVDWLSSHGVEVLNVAGNSEQTYAGCCARAKNYLTSSFLKLGLTLTVTTSEVLAALGLQGDMWVYSGGVEVSSLELREICA